MLPSSWPVTSVVAPVKTMARTSPRSRCGSCVQVRSAIRYTVNPPGLMVSSNRLPSGLNPKPDGSRTVSSLS